MKLSAYALVHRHIQCPPGVQEDTYWGKKGRIIKAINPSIYIKRRLVRAFEMFAIFTMYIETWPEDYESESIEL